MPRPPHDTPPDFEVPAGTISWCNRCDREVRHIILIEDPVFLCVECFNKVSSKQVVAAITPEVWEMVQKALREVEDSSSHP